MQIADIRREKLTASIEPEVTVLAEACDVLGYKVSASRPSEQSRLRQVLAKLEIEPLVVGDVVRYQAERIAELMLDVNYIAKLIGESHEYRFFHFWASQDLSNYHDPIPEFVLAKAIQIKKELPGADFYVQALEGDPDPFLVVKDGYHDYAYIEVWDEPKFEGRLRT